MKKIIRNHLDLSWWSGIFADSEEGSEPPAPPSPHPSYEPQPPVHATLWPASYTT